MRLFLGLELHEIYAHKQHEHRDENYGGKRVHIGLNRFFRHRVYLERQSYEIRARCIVAYHEIVDRKRERHEESRKDSGRDRGKHHLEERLRLGRAEIERRLGQMAVGLRKLRQQTAGKKIAKEIAADWRNAYPRRRAMLDELTSAGF